MFTNRRINVNSIKLNAFYQLPKWLFTEDKYKDLSNDSKVAYALLKDRNSVSIYSAENYGTFIDENDHVYFVYTVNELMEILNKSDKTVTKIKKELIKIGLLEEVRLGQGKANRYYLLEPIFENSRIEEKNPQTLGAVENRKISESEQTLENKGIVNSTILDPKEVRAINTNINNTNNNSLKDIVNKEVTNFENTYSENSLEELEKDLINACDKFYPEFAPGRWNKKQWLTLTSAFVKEAIERNKEQRIKNVIGYVRASLENIAFKHDVKLGNVEITNNNSEIPSVNWLN